MLSLSLLDHLQKGENKLYQMTRISRRLNSAEAILLMPLVYSLMLWSRRYPLEINRGQIFK